MDIDKLTSYRLLLPETVGYDLVDLKRKFQYEKKINWAEVGSNGQSKFIEIASHKDAPSHRYSQIASADQLSTRI